MTLFVLTSWAVQTTPAPYQAVATTDVPISLSLALQTEPPWRSERNEAVRTRPVRHGWDLHWTPQECIPQTEPGATTTHTFPLTGTPTDPERIGILIESPTCALPNPSTPPLIIPPSQITTLWESAYARSTLLTVFINQFWSFDNRVIDNWCYSPPIPNTLWFSCPPPTSQAVVHISAIISRNVTGWLAMPLKTGTGGLLDAGPTAFCPRNVPVAVDHTYNAVTITGTGIGIRPDQFSPFGSGISRLHPGSTITVTI